VTTAAVALTPLQAAVITRLKTTYGVTRLVPATAIYDAVPQDAPYPRIVWEEPSQIPDRTFGQDGSQCAFRLIVGTQDGSPTTARAGSAGFKAGNAIAEEILAAVGAVYPQPDDFTPLVVVGYDLVDLELVDLRGDKLTDGITREIELFLVATLEANAAVTG
jgi:hypothetical protein